MNPFTLYRKAKQNLLSALDRRIAYAAEKKMAYVASRFLPRAMLKFAIPLAEHCNLNCAYCAHFSPVAKPELADFDEVTRDFERLSQLFNGHAQEIHFVGGEPLLHPDIIKFLEMSRAYFPHANISIITNGLMLPKEPEEFWRACKENQINIRLTMYPISFDYHGVEKLAEQYQVRFSFYREKPSDDIIKKTMVYMPLDMEGRQKGTEGFLRCYMANCTYLAHGRLYPCPISVSARHLNEYFGTEFEVLPEDSIDIYAAASSEEISNFLARPIPFCRYCRVDERKGGMAWRQSEKNIKEWIIDNV